MITENEGIRFPGIKSMRSQEGTRYRPIAPLLRMIVKSDVYDYTSSHIQRVTSRSITSQQGDDHPFARKQVLEEDVPE